jgi:hypothetical protein
MVREGKLLPRPEFQRRLVWTHADKDLFLDTILRSYPFPEIYLADGDVNLESGEGTQLLVDGLQRVSTLIEYFEGSSNLRLLTVRPYRELTDTEKTAFLQYDVAVRDLGTISREELVEVFKRLNATKYSLLDIEVNNAVYGGALKKFAESIAEHPFFIDNSVFNARDFKRMGDLRYSLGIVASLVQGYFNRDDVFEELLARYNDDFPLAGDIKARLQLVFDLIAECGFDHKSRIWKKADLYTAIVEIDRMVRTVKSLPQPHELLARLDSFYNDVDEGLEGGVLAAAYYKAAVQATNDRINRLRRGIIVEGILNGVSRAEIFDRLSAEGLVG